MTIQVVVELLNLSRSDLAAFDTNHMHRHSFLVILEYSNVKLRVWSTYIFEITLTASNLEPTLAAVLKRKSIHAINVH